MTRRVPGLSERWAQEQLDLLELAEAPGTCPACGWHLRIDGHAPRCAAGSSGNGTVTEARA